MPVGLPVMPRMNGSPRSIDQSQIDTAAPGSFLKGSFRPDSRPRNERHTITKEMLLIFDCGQRVFLSAADDQPRNVVSNMHVKKGILDGVNFRFLWVPTLTWPDPKGDFIERNLDIMPRDTLDLNLRSPGFWLLRENFVIEG